MASDTVSAANPNPSPNSRPPRGLIDRVYEFLRKFIGPNRTRIGLQDLKSHNVAMSTFATHRGKQELDRLVIGEAIVLARLQSATDMIENGNILELVRRSGLPETFIDPESIDEINEAAKDKNFAQKLWDKTKSVANEKAKNMAKGLIGGGKEEDDESEEG